MGSTLEALKILLEQVPAGFVHRWYPVQSGLEKVLRPLTKEEIEAHEELCDLDADLRALLRKSLRLVRLIEAKHTLLTERMLQLDGRIETAEMRGRVLGLRKTVEDVPVVVEFDPEFTPPFES